MLAMRAQSIWNASFALAMACFAAGCGPRPDQATSLKMFLSELSMGMSQTELLQSTKELTKSRQMCENPTRYIAEEVHYSEPIQEFPAHISENWFKRRGRLACEFWYFEFPYKILGIFPGLKRVGKRLVVLIDEEDKVAGWLFELPDGMTREQWMLESKSMKSNLQVSSEQ